MTPNKREELLRADICTLTTSELGERESAVSEVLMLLPLDTLESRFSFERHLAMCSAELWNRRGRS